MVWQRTLGLNLDISDEWGNWITGFTDGEGCFLIAINENSAWCSFKINLREDDLEILEQIQKRLGGIGKIYHQDESRTRNEKKINRADQYRWQVCRISDIIHVIIPLFEKYPLKTKKLNDFEIWAKAARLIHAKMHLMKEGMEEVIRLKVKMENGRKYQSSN